MFHFLKNKIYFILGILAVIILSLVFGIVVPLAREVNSNADELLSQKNNTAILKSQSGEIENFKKKYDSYKPDLDQMSLLFVDPQNPVDFIKFLEDAASASSIKLNISLVQSLDTKNQNTVAFQLSSNEDFLKMENFVQKVENGPYLIEVKSASFKNADPDPPSKNYPSGKVDASFLINAFIKK